MSPPKRRVSQCSRPSRARATQGRASSGPGRPGRLSTTWGRHDLEALAGAKAPFVIYPKARTADEVREVIEIFEQHGSRPELMLIIETPQAVLRLEQIAACPA